MPPATGVDHPVLLDASQVHTILGSSTAPKYEDSLPDFTVPYVFALRGVPGPPEMFTNNSQAFPLALTEYVNGEQRHCSIQ